MLRASRRRSLVDPLATDRGAPWRALRDPPRAALSHCPRSHRHHRRRRRRQQQQPQRRRRGLRSCAPSAARRAATGAPAAPLPVVGPRIDGRPPTPGAARSCPACDSRSCSVACVQLHKTRQACSGRRARGTFCALADFDDARLRDGPCDPVLLHACLAPSNPSASVRAADYWYLQEIAGAMETAKRRRDDAPRNRDVRRIAQLRAAARRRRIVVRLMPPAMSRHRANTSHFDRRRNCIVWRIEWRIAYDDDAGLATGRRQASIIESGADNLPLRELLGRLLAQRTNAASHALPPAVRSRFAAALRDGSVALYWPRCGADAAPDAHGARISLDATLEEALRERTVVEFPTVHVALSDAATDDRCGGSRDQAPPVDAPLHDRFATPDSAT